jgi:hypothetical protein
VLPEIKFDSAGVVPPTVFPVAPSARSMPRPPRATVPAAFDPMMLPAMTLSLPGISRLIPQPPVAEMMLRAAGVAPPIVLPEDSIRTPLHPLARAIAPVGSTPMKLPEIVLAPTAARMAELLPPGARLIARPWIVLGPAWISSRPPLRTPTPLPSISIRIAALSPTGSVLTVAPGWE